MNVQFCLITEQVSRKRGPRGGGYHYEAIVQLMYTAVHMQYKLLSSITF